MRSFKILRRFIHLLKVKGTKSMNRILTRLRREGKEFITSDELVSCAKSFYFNYKNMIKYLISKREIIEIYDDIIYMKNQDEIISNKLQYSTLELVSKGLEFKKVENWYFGLYTAFKLNGIEYKPSAINYILIDKLYTIRQFDIGKHKFKFLVLNPDLFSFGIIENKYRYSDLEKTILDFIYFMKASGKPVHMINKFIINHLKRISIDKILNYSQFYPKTNRHLLEELLIENN